MIRWGQRVYSEQKFIETWMASNSIRECAIKLGIGPTSPTTRKTANELGLTTEHMNPFSDRKNQPQARPLKDVLVYGKEESSTNLRLRLVKSGILKLMCSSCSLTEWLGSPIPLELDHINGDRLDNTIENLRLLCPNCHALTDTYRGKNVKEWYTNHLASIKPTCSFVGCEIVLSDVRCFFCRKHVPRKTKIEWPEISDLEEMLRNFGYEETGRKLGVSGNSIRRKFYNLGLPLPVKTKK